MISNLSNTIADFYIAKNIITSEERDVYKWGIELILNDILTFLIVIIISLLFFEIRYGLEFLIVFCCTRIYCGGYHAPRTYLCRGIMLVTYMMVVAGSVYLEKIGWVLLSISLFISLMIMIPIIPIKHPNKTMTYEIKRKGKRNGIILYLFFALCAILIYKYVNTRDGTIVGLSLCTVTVLAIIGYINDKRRCSDEKVRE